jgi:glucose-6-phosphate 1-dehydrogenase
MQLHRHPLARRPPRLLGYALALLALLFGLRPLHASEPPATIVILGASGDLSGRLLMPALQQLSQHGILGEGARVVGWTRPNAAYQGDAGFRAWMKTRVATLTGKPVDEGAWQGLEGKLHLHEGDLGQAQDFAALKAKLEAMDKADMASGAITQPRRVVFYYAVAPSLIEPVTQHLAANGLIGPGTGNDVVPEKPIGTDAKSARRIVDVLVKAAGRDHVFFMDHYNGKAGVESLRQLRLGDPRFGKIWNKKYISAIEMRALEKIGAEGRGAYYDGAGATRDMIQSHLLQALSFATMSKPGSDSPAAVRDAKIALLESLAVSTSKQGKPRVVRGQYRAGGGLGDYAAEKGVTAGSSTETYVRMGLGLGDGPLKGVPLSVESGKGMPRKESQLEVRFRRLPLELAQLVGQDPDQPASLHIDFDSGDVKLGGKPLQLGGKGPSLLAYARQLKNVLVRDHSSFPDPREIEASWKLVDPILAGWRSAGQKGLRSYKAGGRGPQAAKQVSRLGR